MQAFQILAYCWQRCPRGCRSIYVHLGDKWTGFQNVFYSTEICAFSLLLSLCTFLVYKEVDLLSLLAVNVAIFFIYFIVVVSMENSPIFIILRLSLVFVNIYLGVGFPFVVFSSILLLQSSIYRCSWEYQIVCICLLYSKSV